MGDEVYIQFAQLLEAKKYQEAARFFREHPKIHVHFDDCFELAGHIKIKETRQLVEDAGLAVLAGLFN